MVQSLLPAIVCGLLAMGIGFVWYGPLFGKLWARVVGATEMDAKRRAEMQKAAGPLYGVQFVLTVWQVWVVSRFLPGTSVAGDLHMSVFLWAGLLVPLIAGTAMWNNDSAKISWTRFLLQAGYQLILFIVFALVFSAWR